MQNKEIADVRIYSLTQSKIARLSLLSLPLLGAGWALFGLLTFFLPAFHNSIKDSIGTTLVGLVFFVLMVLLYRAIIQSSLVLTQDGITYSTFGSRMYTPWQNVIALEKFRPYPYTVLHWRKFMGFKLRQKYVVGMKLAEGRAQQIPVMETAWFNPARSMYPFADRLPITAIMVGRNWQEGEFGRDVRRHAPWLFASPKDI